MKNNKYIKILRLLFIISFLISILLISGTYAKYMETVTSSHQGNIKEWKIKIKDEDIREEDFMLENVITPTFVYDQEKLPYVADDVIAPAKEGYFDVEIDASEVGVNFVVDFELTSKPTTEDYNNMPDLYLYGYTVDGVTRFNVPEGYQQVEYSYIQDGNLYLDTYLAIPWQERLAPTSFSLQRTGDESQEGFGDAENGFREGAGDAEGGFGDGTGDAEGGFGDGTGGTEGGSGEGTGGTEGGPGEGTGDGSNDETEEEKEYEKGFEEEEEEVEEKDRLYPISFEPEGGESDNKVRVPVEYELVPVYRKSDRLMGVYDMATRAFIWYRGTGTLGIGKDVTDHVFTPGSKKTVRVHFKWVDGFVFFRDPVDGNDLYGYYSPVDELDNLGDTNHEINNEDIQFTLKAIFEQVHDEDKEK